LKSVTQHGQKGSLLWKTRGQPAIEHSRSLALLRASGGSANRSHASAKMVPQEKAAWRLPASLLWWTYPNEYESVSPRPRALAGRVRKWSRIEALKTASR
jgi:hypothetical protein